MIPLSGWVLGAAAVLTSPALYAALVTGTMPIDVALTRFLLTTAACWVAASVARAVIWPDETATLEGEGDPARSGRPEE